MVDDPIEDLPEVEDLEFTPSNITAEQLVAGTAALILDNPGGLVEIDTDDGSIAIAGDALELPGVEFFSQAQADADAPELAIFAATDLSITADTAVVVRGSRALVFAVRGQALIAGELSAVGGLDAISAPGPGGFRGGTGDDIDGAGPGGGKSGGLVDAGAGGGGHAAGGGKGGDRADPINNAVDPGGDGGLAHGTDALVPLVGGSGGGRGGDLGGPGGGGGGAVQISAVSGITIEATGGINVGGGGGRSSSDDDGGGGGGAGGALLLESPTIEVSAGFLTANGGGGGSGGDDLELGNNGESGRGDITAAAGGPRAGEGAPGGDGGNGAAPAGVPGTDSAGEENVDENSGGGGGAAGRIMVRASSFTASDAAVSPIAVERGL